MRPGTIDKLLNDWFGYQAEIKDGGLVVPANDPALRTGPPDVLELRGTIDLRETSPEEAGRQLAAAVPDEFSLHTKEADAHLPREVRIAGGVGLLSELTLLLTKIAIAEPQELAGILSNELIPFLITRFSVTHVTPVVCNSGQQQSYFSFAKIAALTERFGADEAQRRVQNQQALAGFEMSAGFELLYGTEALTRMMPMAYTLPVQRWGCIWHFCGQHGLVFPETAVRSVFGTFPQPITPRSTRASMFAQPPVLQGDDIWRLLRQSVIGINSLMRYLNDPRTFADDNGNVDWMAQLRAYGAVYMLLADLASTNYTMQSYDKATAAFGFLDKLANTKAHMGCPNSDETKIFNSLLSLAQGKELKGLFQQHIATIHPTLGQELIKTTGRVYAGLHRSLARQAEIGDKNEPSRLERLRALRNLTHGPFLRGGRFDKLFLGSEGVVPAEIGTVPWLLMLGLLTDPETFLRAKP
ncbi:MAG: hypothetical protein IH994_04025 [Proteobacteria bacterium]|nr:hypothetical protein [Pseudomonadota bacterium]